MPSFYISNKNSEGQFLRETLGADRDGGSLNYDITTDCWQTWSPELAERKRARGFKVVEFGSHEDFQNAVESGEIKSALEE
jgi:hypothetical protein